MAAIRVMAAGLLMLGLLAGVRAEEKKAEGNKEKLIGTWEVVKSDEGAPPAGTVVMFAKDGKMKITHKKDDKEMTGEGTYTVEGDKISVTLKHGDKEDKHTVTIKKLTATEFVAANDEGKTAAFKKVK
jgi:uncharacterized protein (TIGR03066 family)